MAERWRGTTTLQGGKVHYDIQATKSVITTDFQGPYSECIAKKPKIGATITGFPTDHKITSAKITELDGGAGRIDIVLEAAQSDSTFSTDPLGEPTYEVEWAELQKPIEAHKDCGTLNPDRSYYKDGVAVDGPTADQPSQGKQRTWEDWADLVTDTDLDGAGDYTPTTALGDPAWTLAEYRGRKEAGQDAYVIYQPIIRRTTIHLAKPADLGNGSGIRQTPPGAAGFARVADFEWLGGPDRCARSGRTYTRSSEWHGAEIWDELTYPD